MSALERRRWPWSTILEIVRQAVYESEAAAHVRNLSRQIDAWRAMPPPAQPDPFVCILVTGEGPEGPTMLGMSGRAGDGTRWLQLDTQYPLDRVSVMVFCDLERVDITEIRLGKDVVTAGPGSCPGATFSRWDIGVRLLVGVRRMDGGK